MKYIFASAFVIATIGACFNSTDSKTQSQADLTEETIPFTPIIFKHFILDPVHNQKLMEFKNVDGTVGSILIEDENPLLQDFTLMEGCIYQLKINGTNDLVAFRSPPGVVEYKGKCLDLSSYDKTEEQKLQVNFESLLEKPQGIEKSFQLSLSTLEGEETKYIDTSLNSEEVDQLKQEGFKFERSACPYTMDFKVDENCRLEIIKFAAPGNECDLIESNSADSSEPAPPTTIEAEDESSVVTTGTSGSSQTRAPPIKRGKL